MKADFGLQKLENHLQEFISLGEEYLRDARSGRSYAHCLQDPTYIRRSDAGRSVSAAGASLALDIGGTHTKAALALFHPTGETRWQVLFDIDNKELGSCARGELPIVTCATHLAQALRKSIKAQGIALSFVTSVSIVWSNQLQTKPLESGALQGVTGLVVGVNSGGSYRKGEWFTEGLYDGFDLGALFQGALAAVGFTPAVFLIGNDTAFTLTALPGAHAGVVASSGGNCTDVGTSDSDRDLIFNTEIGGLFKVPALHLSDGDLARAEHTKNPVAFEDLFSGKWLPGVLGEHIVLARQSGSSALAALADAIRENQELLSTRDLSAILTNGPLRPEVAKFVDGSSSARETLHQLTTAIARRGGVAAAALCYFSLFNQIDSGLTDCSVSLDSAMARHLPGYFESLESSFCSLLERRSVRGKVTLVRPFPISKTYEVSVPVMGATFAGALWK
jgi:hypothetical protein